MDLIGKQLLKCLPLNTRLLHTTASCEHLMKLTRCRVVDNSAIGKLAMAEGKPPKIIHVYNKKGIGTIGKSPSLGINLSLTSRRSGSIYFESR